MRFWAVASVSALVISLIPPSPTWAQQKGLTQAQVQAMVREGLADESGAKLIEQDGIDFLPTEDFLHSVKAAGASEGFLKALRSATRPESSGPNKPLNQVQVLALLAGEVSSRRVAMLVEERGIDFEPQDEYLEEVRQAGGGNELIRALRVAKVTKELGGVLTDARKEVEVHQHVARGGIFPGETVCGCRS